MVYLQNYSWPGNVRELENAVHGALVMADTSPVRRENLPNSVRHKIEIPGNKQESHSLQELLLSNQEEIEKKAILEALAKFDGKKVAAAKDLGMSRSSFFRRLKGMIFPDSFKEKTVP